MDELSLKGKVSVVTGSTSGIGREIARIFAEHGSEVALIGRSLDRGREAADEVEKMYKNRAVFYKCDVGNQTQAKETCKSILSDFKKVDILVCNAGWTVNAPLEVMDLKVWDKAISVNLSGAFYFIRYLVGSMLENKKGNIIIIGSSTTASGSGGGVHYAASKAGLIGLVKGITYELLPRGIRSNIITPALIDTPLLRKRYPDNEETNRMLSAQVPVGRLGKPSDIACTALFLASDISGYIVGQEIIVDGGRILYRHPGGS